MVKWKRNNKFEENKKNMLIVESKSYIIQNLGFSFNLVELF